MIIFVGGQGSGKSTFWRNYLNNYKRINNDTIKNTDKAQKLCRELLTTTSDSVVIDNCGTSTEIRQKYIKIANDCGIKQIRCLYFNIEKPQCLTNNTLRKVENERNISKAVPTVVIHTHFKRFVKPEQKEGFTHPVIEIPFVFFDQNQMGEEEWNQKNIQL